MIETGKILQQRYRIDKQIGQGGMGAVYVATDERFGSVVAIKETLLMDESYRKASEREARLLNSLKHQALPRVTDHFLEDNGQFLVMEFIPGEDLGHILERDAKPFPVEKVLNWADQLLDALEYLHTQTVPVIHRDIKPQNLKLTPRGQIILLDFGLAKGNPTDAGHQTAAKSIFGYSRSYASLEQIQGTGTDPRSDLYSLAATLYHLITAEPAVDALTRAMAVLAGASDPLQPANEVNGAVPTGVAGVLQRVMDLNAAARPGSASEMRQMFRKFEEYEVIERSASTSTMQSRAASAHPTKLMPENTRRGDGESTDVRTELHPGYDSEETKIRTSVAHSLLSTNVDRIPGAKRKSRSSMIAVLGGVLLICAGAFGAYLYKTGLFPESSPNGVNVSQPVDVPASNISAEPLNKTPEGSEGVISEQNGPDKSVAEKGQTPQGPDRRENTKSTGSTTREKEPVEDPGDSTIYVGNIKVTNDRTKTHVTIVDGNGIPRPIIPNPAAPNFPALTPEQMRQMTPAERRRIRRLYLRSQGNYPVPPKP